MANRFALPVKATHVDHGIVYRNEAEFCGWPFYSGLWKTADGSLVCSFKRVPNSYASYADVSHDTLTRNKGRLCVIRSRDAGQHWDPATLQPVFDMNVARVEDLPEPPADYATMPPLDLASRDTLIMAGTIPGFFAPDGQTWLRASIDGGRTWRPPTILPRDQFPSLTATGSSMYSTRADGVHLLGVSTTLPDTPGMRAMIYACADGAHWHFLSFVTPERPDEAAYYKPRTTNGLFGPAAHFLVRPLVLRDGRVLCSMRYQRDPRGLFWVEMWHSADGGRSWEFLSRVNDQGAPGDIVEMADGRIVCVYGFRLKPYGIRYRVSQDGGRTWGASTILRDDGGSWDLGYPRVIELAPGTLLATYYFNLASDPVQQNGGIRHIARTSFEP
jgi:hypothetical protein